MTCSPVVKAITWETLLQFPLLPKAGKDLNRGLLAPRGGPQPLGYKLVCSETSSLWKLFHNGLNN